MKIFVRTLIYFVSAALFASFTTGCANLALGAINAMNAGSEKKKIEASKKPEMTQLQIREMQTREIEETNTIKILGVALAVLQDDGFSVENANTEMGLLSARKSLHNREVDNQGKAFAKGFVGFGMGNVSEDTVSHIEATVTVTQFGDEQTRVRLSSRIGETSTRGHIKYEAVTEPDFYIKFFQKLYNGLGYEQEGI